MEVTISSKYQIVIPSAVRKELGIKPGEKATLLTYHNRIELVPVRPLRQLRGLLKGMDTVLRRDEDRL
jgi:AbrB family looped-hinge helix DNA binding protein